MSVSVSVSVSVCMCVCNRVAACTLFVSYAPLVLLRLMVAHLYKLEKIEGERMIEE